MEGYYIGLDVHKKTISYCVKEVDGRICEEGIITANRDELRKWAEGISRPWSGAMEATMFTGWIYDFLKPYAKQLEVGHSYMLKSICASKKKNDRVDAMKLADLLRSNLFPKCYMADGTIRELRRIMRYRNLIVCEATRMKNKTSGLLMEVGAEYNKKRLHGDRYFKNLLDNISDIPESVIDLLNITHSNVKIFDALQKRLVNALTEHPILRERVELLESIPGVGEVTALTWALEIGDPRRFPSIKEAVSYCGLCGPQDESAGKTHRHPLSKQRNKHLQTVLIEAAKLAPRWNPQLEAVHDVELERGKNRNDATLQVARKLVAYLLYVDKSGNRFVLRNAA
jgi:transposase